MDNKTNLLEATYKSAAKMTHALRDNGQGDMGQGIRNLVESSHKDGVIEGVIGTLIVAVATAAAVVIPKVYKYCSNKREQRILQAQKEIPEMLSAKQENEAHEAE